MGKEKMGKYIKEKYPNAKEKQKPAKAFSTLTANEKWALVELMLRDLKYID